MNQVEIKRRQMQTVSVILALITVAVIARLTGYNGASYTIAALEAFSVLWMVIGGNLSDVLGRMIRIRNSKGQYRNAEQLRKNTLIFQLVLGLAGSLFLLFGADWLARTVFRTWGFVGSMQSVSEPSARRRASGCSSRMCAILSKCPSRLTMGRTVMFHSAA